jgi:hypothetical protein
MATFEVYAVELDADEVSLVNLNLVTVDSRGLATARVHSIPQLMSVGYSQSPSDYRETLHLGSELETLLNYHQVSFAHWDTFYLRSAARVKLVAWQ